MTAWARIFDIRQDFYSLGKLYGVFRHRKQAEAEKEDESEEGLAQGVES
jgi:hypothetical protein